VRPYWLDALPAREPYPALTAPAEADLGIVGAGFTGLWAALHAKREDPGRDVVVLEADTIGHGASGRNGGFLASSLTHGIANGMARFAEEMPTLERLGDESYAGLKADLETYGIDCDFEETGDLTALLEPYQDAWIDEEVELLQRFGHEVEVLDQAGVRAELNSPTYRGGIWDKTGTAIVHPGKLVDGLRAAAERVQRLLRQGAQGQDGLRTRLHGTGSGRIPVRCSDRARPAERQGNRGHPPPVHANQAPPLPAGTALDLLNGRETEATRLRYTRTKPLLFPPEPLKTAVIQLTRNRLDKADRNQGKRGVWLKTLDRLGLGFDS
jgi:hypothetical protein